MPPFCPWICAVARLVSPTSGRLSRVLEGLCLVYWRYGLIIPARAWSTVIAWTQDLDSLTNTNNGRVRGRRYCLHVSGCRLFFQIKLGCQSCKHEQWTCDSVSLTTRKPYLNIMTPANRDLSLSRLHRSLTPAALAPPYNLTFQMDRSWRTKFVNVTVSHGVAEGRGNPRHGRWRVVVYVPLISRFTC
jgi:hypothetical protein